MTIATMTSKGQLTVPIDVRQKLGLQAGSRVQFVEHEDGTYSFVPLTRSVTELKGMFRWDGPPITIEQMNEAIAEAAAESGAA